MRHGINKIYRGFKNGMRSALLSCLSMLVASCAYMPLPNDFNITDGNIEAIAGNHLVVDTKEMRATLKFPTRQRVAVKFVYLGPTGEVSHLRDGEIRSQFGIKLRAQDTCNTVYVMWHFNPVQRIAVSVKRNPGQRIHEDCLDNGYINDIVPRVSAPPPIVQMNEPHVLVVSMKGSILTVKADHAVVWKGDLGPVALEFNGPVGLRSDNAQVVFKFSVNR